MQPQHLEVQAGSAESPLQSVPFPAPPAKGTAPRSREGFDHERFNNVASGLQSFVVIASIIIGGIWTWSTFTALLDRERAQAELEKMQADAEIAKRKLAPTQVVNLSLAVPQVIPAADGLGWFVDVEVSVVNTGNKPVKIDLSTNETRFYVARLSKLGNDGIGEYEHRRDLKFDYADKTITWFNLTPGALMDKIHALQRVDEPGIYVARFAVQLPDPQVGEGREYSSEVFFSVPLQSKTEVNP